MRPLIGIGGWAGAGKDAVADILEGAHGYRRTRMSASLEQAMVALDPLVFVTAAEAEAMSAARGSQSAARLVSPGVWRYSDLHATVGYEVSKLATEVRGILQRLGTDVGRDMFGEDVWVRRTGVGVERWLAAGESVAVTGIRYANELEAIRHWGGTLWWVARPGVGPANEHSSETSLGPDDFDMVIANDGSLNDLAATVAAVATIAAAVSVAAEDRREWR